MDLKHIIEALRGGDSSQGVVSARQYPGGQVQKFPYGHQTPQPPPIRSLLPTGLRKVQLHNQEVDVGTSSAGDDY